MFLYYFVHIGVGVQFYSIWIPNCLAPFVEGTFLLPLNYFGTFVGVGVQFYSIWIPNCLAPFVEGTFLLPLNYFGTFVENKIIVSLEIKG